MNGSVTQCSWQLLHRNAVFAAAETAVQLYQMLSIYLGALVLNTRQSLPLAPVGRLIARKAGTWSL